MTGDHPSKHGALLGSALALIAEAGRRDFPGELPPMCATCAFRESSLPNQSAGTGKIALDCILGIDKDRFGCHHGMKEGQPKRLCVGYIAAHIAPFSFVKEVLTAMNQELATMKDSDPDPISDAFEAWAITVDPDRKMDVYQLARAWAEK